MGDTSSDDELALAQRPLGGILMAARQPVGPASDTESDIPSWLQAGAKGKSNQVVNLTDSDSDDAVLSLAKAAPAAAAAAEPAGNRGQQQQPASQQQQQQQAAAKAAPKSGSKPKATPHGRTAAAAEPAGPDDGGDPPATQAAPASQPATAGGTSQKQRTLAAGLLQAPTSQMAVVLPDELPQLKMLVELELSAGGGGGGGGAPPGRAAPVVGDWGADWWGGDWWVWQGIERLQVCMIAFGCLGDADETRQSDEVQPCCCAVVLLCSRAVVQLCC